MLVFSKLFYCSSVRSGTSAGHISKLQRTQNFAARIINGAKKLDHVTPILKTLGWLPVKKLYETSRASNYLTSITREEASGRVTCNSKQLINIPFWGLLLDKSRW